MRRPILSILANSRGIPMHRLRGIAVVVALVISLSCAAHAQGTAECDFVTELSKIYTDSMEKRANLTVQRMQVLEQFQNLLDKVPDKTSNKPVAEQLDKEGILQFEKLRERQMVLMNASLTESKRMRDMEFFRRFVILAEKDVKWPEIPPDNSPDFVPYVLLNGAREHLGDKVEISGMKNDQCTLEASIQVMEQEVIDKVNSMDTKPIYEFNMLSERMRNKYKMKSLDLQKMSKSDQEAMWSSSEKVQSIIRLRSLAKDFEILKALTKASQLIYDMDKQDILTYGATSDKIGTTLYKKANAGEYGEQIKVAHAFMRVMDKKLPCEDALANERIIDAGKK